MSCTRDMYVFKQVVDATWYLHNKQFEQHRVIKPANILLMANDEWPVAKLTDLNLINLITGELLGSIFPKKLSYLIIVDQTIEDQL